MDAQRQERDAPTGRVQARLGALVVQYVYPLQLHIHPRSVPGVKDASIPEKTPMWLEQVADFRSLLYLRAGPGSEPSRVEHG